jgi:predicted membrane channel-forming protein YqfA (hemolysin III family)
MSIQKQSFNKEKANIETATVSSGVTIFAAIVSVSMAKDTQKTIDITTDIPTYGVITVCLMLFLYSIMIFTRNKNKKFNISEKLKNIYIDSLSKSALNPEKNVKIILD